jgi:predicted peptidase
MRLMRFQSAFVRIAIAFAFLCIPAQVSAATEITKDDVDFVKKVYVNKNGERLPYRLFVPTGYSPQQKYPLVLWLHGGEGRGSDNLQQIVHTNQTGAHVWLAPEIQLKFPAFVLAPQCPINENWADPDLNQPSKALQLALQILAAIQKEFSIDPDRVYVVGQSMGGLGVYSLLQLYPEKWAGAIILAAYDNFTNANAISRVPLWVFQGDQDQTVPVTMVRDMMHQLKKVKANLRYTEYRKADHNIWDRAFAEPELIPWLASLKRAASSTSQLGTSATPPDK